MRRLRVWITVGVLLGPTVVAASDSAADAAPSDMAADAALSDAAQSLADVARAEEARRKATPKAAKVYTNNDLQPDSRSRQTQPAGPAGAPTAPSAGPSSEAAPAAPAPAPDPSSESATSAAQDEKYWRTRITQARERLQRSQLFQEALQSRISALTTDFVNRDDPAQRTVIANDRDTALAELDRVKKEIDDLTKAIADIEEEARRAGVPPGWLR